MMNAAEVRALVVTPDALLASTFVNLARELGIVTHVAGAPEDVSEILGREKYEALLVDFDSAQEVSSTLASLRANPSSRFAVIFAMATANSERQLALNSGANFVLARPLDDRELRRTLWVAYDAMTQERRRYFRCSAELPVFLTRADGSNLVARTGNISANGMSICSSTSFVLGERIGITLDLQSVGPHILASGVVVWDDRHGKTGISFQCVRPELQRALDAWLDKQFQKMRNEAVQELHKARAATPAGG